MSSIGRNDPCPCGSGKKYKKCCLGKEEAVAAERESEIERLEWLVTAMQNLRCSMLERKPHIKEYKRIRRLHSEIGNSMMAYYDEDKFKWKIDQNYTPPPTTAKGGAKERTLILLESSFDPDTREGMQGLAESVIYKSAPNANCITEEFIKSHRYRKPEKLEMLQSMLDSHIGLFEITKTDSEDGYAYLKDVFTGQEYKITDTGLSGNQDYGDFYLYTRIITYRDVSFGTGLSLMFEKADPFMVDFVRREQKDFIPQAEFRRFIELYNQFSKNPHKNKVIANRF